MCPDEGKCFRDIQLATSVAAFKPNAGAKDDVSSREYDLRIYGKAGLFPLTTPGDTMNNDIFARVFLSAIRRCERRHIDDP